MTSSDRNFPNDFVWGTSSSAFQIEGATREDGRGESVWDRFCARSGAIADHSNADIACDHYHRYSEDIDLMAALGTQAYRFSLAWPRIIPDGHGAINADGIDFYDRLIDRLLAAGIEPWICLHHWDLPQAIEDRGGWRNRDTADWFGEYTAVVAGKFSDRVRRFAPINEPNVLIWVGYNAGIHAPGQRPRDECIAAIHHINLAHGKAIKSLRDVDADLICGNIVTMAPVVAPGSAADQIAAAELTDCLWRRVMVDPLMLGRYPDLLADEIAPYILDDDMALISQPLDFFGLNHYNRLYAAQDPSCSFGVGETSPPEGVATTDMGWQIDGLALLEQLRDVRDRYNNPEIYVTENGAAFPDEQNSAGQVIDQPRVDFLYEYLCAVHDAIGEGIKVRGYFEWSLLDNFEWSLGYSKRFGLVHVDYATQKRTPKSSFWYLKEVFAANELLPPTRDYRP